MTPIVVVVVGMWGIKFDGLPPLDDSTTTIVVVVVVVVVVVLILGVVVGMYPIQQLLSANVCSLES